MQTTILVSVGVVLTMLILVLPVVLFVYYKHCCKCYKILNTLYITLWSSIIIAKPQDSTSIIEMKKNEIYGVTFEDIITQPNIVYSTAKEISIRSA